MGGVCAHVCGGGLIFVCRALLSSSEPMGNCVPLLSQPHSVASTVAGQRQSAPLPLPPWPSSKPWLMRTVRYSTSPPPMIPCAFIQMSHQSTAPRGSCSTAVMLNITRTLAQKLSCLGGSSGIPIFCDFSFPPAFLLRPGPAAAV